MNICFLVARRCHARLSGSFLEHYSLVSLASDAPNSALTTARLNARFRLQTPGQRPEGSSSPLLSSTSSARSSSADPTIRHQHRVARCWPRLPGSTRPCSGTPTWPTWWRNAVNSRRISPRGVARRHWRTVCRGGDQATWFEPCDSYTAPQVHNRKMGCEKRIEDRYTDRHVVRTV